MSLVPSNLVTAGANSDIISTYLLAGKTYVVTVNAINPLTQVEGTGGITGSSNQIVDYWNTTGDYSVPSVFTPLNSGTLNLILFASGTYGTDYTIDFAEVDVTTESYINDMLTTLKTYIDSKDTNVKTYAQGLIDQLTQTTDLQAKLDLITQINTILDGDTATAGFQLWQENVNALNKATNDIAKLQLGSPIPFSLLKTKAATLFTV